MLEGKCANKVKPFVAAEQPLSAYRFGATLRKASTDIFEPRVLWTASMVDLTWWYSLLRGDWELRSANMNGNSHGLVSVFSFYKGRQTHPCTIYQLLCHPLMVPSAAG